MRSTGTFVLDGCEVRERFVRAIGARNQNARREATAVELRFDITASSLPQDVKSRLTTLGGRAVNHDGVLVVTSRALRSQAGNRDTARARLIALLRQAATPPRQRLPTRPRKADQERRLSSKHARATVKRLRQGLD